MLNWVGMRADVGCLFGCWQLHPHSSSKELILLRDTNLRDRLRDGLVTLRLKLNPSKLGDGLVGQTFLSVRDLLPHLAPPILSLSLSGRGAVERVRQTPADRGERLPDR